MRRNASGLSGLLAVAKPAGMTSHDVVDRVRRATGERRVGHAGTLDPMATGLLLVAVGPATRLNQYLTGHDKEYRARIAFGTATDTDDAEGRVIRQSPVPEALTDPGFAQTQLRALIGDLEQVPPAYSAVKRQGRKAYEVARAGGELELEPRTVTVYQADLVSLAAGPVVEWTVDLRVSKGTYIRALARDLGRALGSAAHLAGLQRRQSGRVRLEDAVSLEQVEAAGPQGVEALFCDPVAALGLPRIELPADLVAPLRQGKRLPAPGDALALEGLPVAVTSGGRLLSVHRVQGGGLVAMTVIDGGVAGCKEA